MGNKADDLIKRLRLTKRNWSDTDLGTILLGKGLKSRRGKHGILYKHPKHNHLTIQIPYRKGVAPVYPKKVLELVEELHKLDS